MLEVSLVTCMENQVGSWFPAASAVTAVSVVMAESAVTAL